MERWEKVFNSDDTYQLILSGYESDFYLSVFYNMEEQSTYLFYSKGYPRNRWGLRAAAEEIAQAIIRDGHYYHLLALIGEMLEKWA